jgi:hypothetical protein
MGIDSPDLRNYRGTDRNKKGKKILRLGSLMGLSAIVSRIAEAKGSGKKAFQSGGYKQRILRERVLLCDR